MHKTVTEVIAMKLTYTIFFEKEVKGEKSFTETLDYVSKTKAFDIVKKAMTKYEGNILTVHIILN